MRGPVRIRLEREVRDERFRGIGGDQWLEQLHSGCRWTEGPAWFPAGRYLVFSDIPNNRMLRWDETTGVTGVFREPADYANGHTVDRQGRLVSCHHGTRQVTRAGLLANTAVPPVEVDPADGTVRLDGRVLHADPVAEVPLSRTYLLG